MNNERRRRILSTIAFAYAVWVLAWSILWLTVRDGVWWLALLNRVVPQMFAPAPLVWLLAIVSRRREAIIASIVPPLIFAAVYWPYLVPRQTRTVSGPTLKVMTFNVLFSNTDYAGVADVIRRYRPDLVALQEVQPEMMSALTQRLGDIYPYSLVGTENPYGTTAAFSRYPLPDSYVLDLQADRSAVVFEADVEGKPVTFISAHLLAYGLEWIAPFDIPQAVAQRVFEQERQARLLVDDVKKHDGPVILACDCNSKETSGASRILADEMVNAARAVGWVLEPPTIADAQRDTDLQHIDYVFYRGPLTAIETSTLRAAAGSDHQPVMAVLAFADSPAR